MTSKGLAKDNKYWMCVWQLFDHESKGYITEPELAKILHNAFGMSHLDTRQLFARVDSSGDGKISYGIVQF